MRIKISVIAQIRYNVLEYVLPNKIIKIPGFIALLSESYEINFVRFLSQMRTRRVILRESHISHPNPSINKTENVKSYRGRLKNRAAQSLWLIIIHAQ